MAKTSHAPQIIDARKKLCRQPDSGKKLANNNTKVVKAINGTMKSISLSAQSGRCATIDDHGLPGHER